MLLAGPARISSNRLRCGSDQLAQARTAADMGWRHQWSKRVGVRFCQTDATPWPSSTPALPQLLPIMPHRFPSGFSTRHPRIKLACRKTPSSISVANLLLGTGELFESFGKF